MPGIFEMGKIKSQPPKTRGTGFVSYSLDRPALERQVVILEGTTVGGRGGLGRSLRLEGGRGGLGCGLGLLRSLGGNRIYRNRIYRNRACRGSTLVAAGRLLVASLSLLVGRSCLLVASLVLLLGRRSGRLLTPLLGSCLRRNLLSPSRSLPPLLGSCLLTATPLLGGLGLAPITTLGRSGSGRFAAQEF